jgi:hypothetical protein
MEELDRLQKGLQGSQRLVLKQINNTLECSFIKEGIVQDNFMVTDEVLISALTKKGKFGVLEGFNFNNLRTNYGWFSLHVKSKKLLKELQ